MHIANVLFADRFGGPPRRVIEVGSGLAAQGFRTTIVLPDRADKQLLDKAVGRVDVATISIARIPNPSSPIAVLRWLASAPMEILRFVALFRRLAVDAVHVNGAMFVTPAIAARIAGKALVWHINDTSVPQSVAVVLGLLVKCLATVRVAAAHAAARHYGIGDRYQVVYPPVDVGQFVPAPERANRAPGQAMRIGFLGNWSRDKDPVTFARAVARLRETNAGQFVLVFAGARPDNHKALIEEAYAILREADLADRVEDHGFSEDMASIVQSLDVLVLSSAAEAAPMVVLEAMASGVPVVATDAGGVRELIAGQGREPAGLVVDVRDFAAIADALQHLHDDPELGRRLAHRGRTEAEERFSLATCIAAHALIYGGLRRSRT